MPATAAPGATPATSPVCSSAIPSVSRAGGVTCSIMAVVAISVGAIAKPPTSISAAITTLESTSASGAMATTSPTAPHRIRWVSPRRKVTAPVIAPASRLPSAHRARSGPAADLLPCSSANATVMTSAPPNIRPSATQTTVSGARVRQGSGTRGPAARSTGCAGGSVPRWAANARLPPTPATTVAAMPATGSTRVASRVTRIGPTMKTDSSTTASNA